MGYIDTHKERFGDIAEAIREKKLSTNEIEALDFAPEIRALDVMRPMNTESEFENGYWGIRAVLVAMSYQLNRTLGNDTFQYQSTGNLMTSGVFRVRDDAGRGLIDCSAYIGLVLRGITYDNGPFPIHRNANETWMPSSEMPAMYGAEGWEFRIIDQQPQIYYPNYNLGYSDLGFDGYYSLRTAADFAEFFYRCGYLIFDSTIDGDSVDYESRHGEPIYRNFKPGDIVFWARGNRDTALHRFRQVSHVGIVAEREDRYFNVTGTEGVEGLTVLYSSLDSNIENIVLVIRPKYIPSGESTDPPIGENLVHYPWNYGATLSSDDYEGLTYTNVEPNANGDNGLHISGSSTNTELEGTLRRLKGNPETDTGYLHLAPGTYTLSGMEGSGIENYSFELHIMTPENEEIDATDTDGNPMYTGGEYGVRACDGHPCTFMIAKEQNVMLRLWCGYGQAIDSTIYPSLIRNA